MRTIDADVLKQHIDKLPALPDGNFAGNHSALKALINMQPTIEPSAQPEITTCIDCIHYIPLGKDKAWGRCSAHSSPTENQRMCQSCDFCAWAERRTDG